MLMFKITLGSRCHWIRLCSHDYKLCISNHFFVVPPLFPRQSASASLMSPSSTSPSASCCGEVDQTSWVFTCCSGQWATKCFSAQTASFSVTTYVCMTAAAIQSVDSPMGFTCLLITLPITHLFQTPMPCRLPFHALLGCLHQQPVIIGHREPPSAVVLVSSHLLCSQVFACHLECTFSGDV